MLSSIRACTSFELVCFTAIYQHLVEIIFSLIFKIMMEKKDFLSVISRIINEIYKLAICTRAREMFTKEKQKVFH